MPAVSQLFIVYVFNFIHYLQKVFLKRYMNINEIAINLTNYGQHYTASFTNVTA